ncbi:glycosyltransferase [Chromobacterium violaceum]|uniref:glycosyltransferase n=1 Tax=Chromobacterium violaceum TaxID=536 RepID=UPI0005D3E56D|nr:glycosyltransferase [Chromobacterium violaceum]
MEKGTLPEFSILMAVYHRDDPVFFERAVNSVYKNSVLPLDFILVVDGPVGAELASLILSLQNHFRLKVIWLHKNEGLANALNVGLKHVTTEWVVRADADDYNMPYRFERQILDMAGETDLFGAAIVEVDKAGKKLGCRMLPCKAEELHRFAGIRNPFNHMTVCFRTHLALSAGGYPNIHLKEDYGLWALMMKNGARIMNSNEILVEATAGREMYIRRGGWKYAKAEIDLQLHLVRCNVKSILSAFFHGAIRAIFFLLPGALRGVLYQTLLRQRSLH